MKNPDLDSILNNPSQTMTTIVYGLQAVSFLLGFTLLVAVVINYVIRNDLAGTWLASHNRWQLRTFWFWLLWTVVGMLTTWMLIGWLIIAVNTVWLIYRIVRGWLALSKKVAI